MTRRTGLIVLLVCIVLSVLLAWALRTSPGADTRAVPGKGEAQATLTASDVAAPSARPAVVRGGRLTGGNPAAPEGFDVSVSAVELREILDPGLRPEDVPSLDTPRCVSAGSSDAPADNETVVGIVVDGVARAYPLGVLDYHWAVNDLVGGRRVLILWDPIAGAAAAYQGTIDGRPVEAGVSGKWYRTSALFYDRQSTSLFPAITGRFITGPLTNRALRPIPYRRESWKAWRERQEHTQVLPCSASRGEGPRSTPPAAFGANDRPWANLLANAPGSQTPLDLHEWVMGFVDPIGKPTCCALKDLPEDEPLRLGRALIERQPGGGVRVTLSGGVWPQQTVCRYAPWVYLHPDSEVWPKGPVPTP
jgi:hypothetical protein